MEKWQEVYKEVIPKEKYGYDILVQNGDEFGLLVELEGKENIVKLFFGVGASNQMLEEGIVPSNRFRGKDYKRFRDNGFSNTIYKVEGGKFEKLAKQVSSDLYEILNMKHYVIITTNYVIEVITVWEPDIEVVSKKNYKSI